MSDTQVIDQLGVEITSSIKGEKKIENFSDAIRTLARNVSAVNTSKLQGVATAFKNFANSTSGMNVNGVKNLTNSLARLSDISPNLSGLNGMVSAISGLSTVADKAGDLSKLSNSLGRIAKADMSGFNSNGFTQMTSSIASLAGSLANTEDIDNKVVRLVSALGKLANSGEHITTVSAELPKLGTSLTTLVKDISGAGTVDANISKLVDGIARLANAGKKVGDTTQNLDVLGDAVLRLLQKLQQAPAINTNLANTIQGLGNLANSGVKFGSTATATTSSTSHLGNGLKSLARGALAVINPFKSLTSVFGGVQKKSAGLASSIGMLYAKFWIFKRLAEGIGKATGSAQDYIEGFNYFNVALQKIGDDSKEQFRQAGYDSAEEYAKSFQTRFTKLQKQMTGYDVDPFTGDATFAGSHYLGLDLTDTMQYQAEIAQITNATGQLGEVSIATSKALSMLSADWASLTNQDLTAVQDNFRSGLIGQSRALYKYGIDITNAGLQQIAYNHGIDMSTAKMSNMAKQQLRVIGMLEQSKVAYSDLARTINQPANQLRMLQAGFANLSRTIGSLFLPMIQKVYPYLNALVMVLQSFVTWIAKIAGIKLGDGVSSYKPPEIDYGGAVDDSAAVADNTGKAAKAAKKLNDNIQGFDIINKLDSDKDSSGGGSGGGGGGGGDFDLSDDINALLKGYEDIWNRAFASSQNKAVELAEKIKKSLIDGWNKGGEFTKYGVALGEWINKGLRKIPWTKIYDTVTKLTRSVATFLNGLIKGTDWKLIGKTLANGLNTVIQAGYTWWTTFDWLQFGKSIGEGLQSAIDNFDAWKWGKYLGAKLRGTIQFAFGFISKLNFKKIGKKISDAINGFFEDMGRVDPRTGLSGWAELGKTISDAVIGIGDTILTALEKINWTAVGTAIADFLGKIDWVGLFTRVGKIIVKAFGGVLKATFEAFKSDPMGMTQTIIAVVGGWFAFKKLTGLWTTVKSMFALGANKSIVGGIAEGIGDSGSQSIIMQKLNTLFSKLWDGIKWGFSKIKLSAPIQKLIEKNAESGASFKNLGATLIDNFRMGVTSGGTWHGISMALQTKISTLGGTGILAAAAVAAGTAIGQIWCNAIDEQIEAHEFAQSTGHDIGKRMSQSTYDAINKTQDAIKGDYSVGSMNNDELLKAYQDLSKKKHKSATESKVLKAYEKQLKDVYPGLTKNTLKSSKALKKFQDEQKRAENITKAQQKAAELYNKQNGLKSAYDDAAKAVKDAEDRMKSFQTKHKETIDKYNNAKLEFNWTTMEWENPYQDEYNRVMAEMGEYAEAVNEARGNLTSLKNEQKKNNAELEKANNLLELGKVKNEEYDKSFNGLKKKISGLGFTSKDTRGYLKKLHKMLDNGQISWKNYKKLVDGNYDSQEAFKQAYLDVIKTSPEYKDAVETLKNKLKELGMKQSDINGYLDTMDTKLANGEISLGKYKTMANKAYKSTKEFADEVKALPSSKTTTVSVKTPGVASTNAALDNLARNRTSVITIKTRQVFETVGNPNSRLTKTPNNTLASKIKNYNTMHTKGIQLQLDGSYKIPKDAKDIIKLFKDQGIKYKTYKKGGFIEDGLFTMNRGEIAGKFDNGKSVVANNQQITQGFAEGITQTLAPAIYSAVKQAMSEESQSSGEQNVNVYLDGKQLADNTVKYVRQMNRSNGRSVFA